MANNAPYWIKQYYCKHCSQEIRGRVYWLNQNPYHRACREAARQQPEWGVEDPDHKWHRVYAPDPESAEQHAERDGIQVVRVVPWADHRDTIWCPGCNEHVIASIDNDTSLADHGLCVDCMDRWKRGELGSPGEPSQEEDDAGEDGVAAGAGEDVGADIAAALRAAQLRHDAAAPWVALWRKLGDDMPCPQCGQEQIKTQDRTTLCLRCGWQAHNPVAV